MVDDFKGPDGVDYSPIDLYAKYRVTPEQVRRDYPILCVNLESSV